MRHLFAGVEDCREVEVVVEWRVVERAKKYGQCSCGHWSCWSWTGVGLLEDPWSRERNCVLRLQVETSNVSNMPGAFER
jgi:hypothetical protein